MSEPEDRPDAKGTASSLADGIKHMADDNQRPAPAPQVLPKLTQADVNSLDYRKERNQGRAVIINNKNFHKKNGDDISKRRKGTDNDKRMMEILLHHLGFEPINRRNSDEKSMSYDDVSAENLNLIMEDAADDNLNNYTDYGCFLCVILSFGDPGVIYCKGEKHNIPVELKTLQEPFKKSTTLRLRPKMFLIQGCSYTEKDRHDGPGDDDGAAASEKTMKIPRESDFLFHFSSYPGYTVWNFEADKPSPYISALDKAVREFCINNKGASIDFLRVLTRVNNYMYEDTKVADYIPLVTSLLTKRVYFHSELLRLDK